MGPTWGRDVVSLIGTLIVEREREREREKGSPVLRRDSRAGGSRRHATQSRWNCEPAPRALSGNPYASKARTSWPRILHLEPPTNFSIQGTQYEMRWEIRLDKWVFIFQIFLTIPSNYLVKQHKSCLKSSERDCMKRDWGGRVWRRRNFCFISYQEHSSL